MSGGTKWTRETIIAALHRWIDEYGEPPTHDDWNPTAWKKRARLSRARMRAQLERAARREQGEWPNTWAVSACFGPGPSWRRMFLAAGLQPRRVGRPSKIPPPVTLPERELAERTAARLRYAADRPGPDELATRVRQVAMAKGNGDPAALRACLYQLAATAVAWIDVLDNEKESSK